MRATVRPLLAAAAVFAVGVAAQAAPTGEQLLRHSKEAERNHSYRGARISRMYFPKYTVTATSHVIHRRPDTTRIEYLAPAPLSGTIMLQIGQDRWRRHPREGGWRRAAEAPDSDALNLLMRNYILRVGQGAEVAQRECLLLVVAPRHDGNPSKRMWIDRATGLVLRTELLNWKQENISTSAFREIEIDPDLSDHSALLTPPKPPQAPPAPVALGFQPIHPQYVPSGYEFIGTSTTAIGGYPAAHLRYTDGLNTISLFQAPAKAFAQETPFGATELSFTQVITWRRGNMAYALMGDVNPAELRRMADSVGPSVGIRMR
ncbi:MAG: hypothetical protein JSV65_05025 [Armatimonadota bacterium]|nr:MAG: hypothetical protein JSV65_05025 [Armatimonadota bacterium]